MQLLQKERLEELWPRCASSLLLRLSADEPAYDSPIFDTGEGMILLVQPSILTLVKLPCTSWQDRRCAVHSMLCYALWHE